MARQQAANLPLDAISERLGKENRLEIRQRTAPFGTNFKVAL